VLSFFLVVLASFFSAHSPFSSLVGYTFSLSLSLSLFSCAFFEANFIIIMTSGRIVKSVKKRREAGEKEERSRRSRKTRREDRGMARLLHRPVCGQAKQEEHGATKGMPSWMEGGRKLGQIEEGGREGRGEGEGERTDLHSPRFALFDLELVELDVLLVCPLFLGDLKKGNTNGVSLSSNRRREAEKETTNHYIHLPPFLVVSKVVLQPDDVCSCRDQIEFVLCSCSFLLGEKLLSCFEVSVEGDLEEETKRVISRGERGGERGRERTLPRNSVFSSSLRFSEGKGKSAGLGGRRKGGSAYLTSLRRRVRGCAGRETGSRLISSTVRKERYLRDLRTHTSSSDPDGVTFACLQRDLDEIFQPRTAREGGEEGKEGELELNRKSRRSESRWRKTDT